MGGAAPGPVPAPARPRSRLGPAFAWLLNLPLTLLILLWLAPALRREMADMGWRPPPSMAAFFTISRLAGRHLAIAGICAAIVGSAAAAAITLRGKARLALRTWTVAALIVQLFLVGAALWALYGFSSALIQAK